jgi:hypothetical protein
MNKSLILTTVNTFRNMAISLLRLQRANGLVETLQIRKANLVDVKTDLDNVKAKREGVISGAIVISLGDLGSYESVEKAKEAIVKAYDASIKDLEAAVECAGKEVTRIEEEVSKMEAGEYKFSRQTITNVADALMEKAAYNGTLPMVVTEEK